MKQYTVQKTFIPSPAGRMKVLVLRPARQAEKPGAVGILWIHGGGYAVGMAEMIYMSRALNLVKKYGAVVVTPAYRLAGQAPYPAALEDCYAALAYLWEQADALGVDRRKIIVGGESAGGGLTASVCMLAREKGEIPIAYQLPLYPMLDDRDTPSSANNHGLSWNTRRNHAAWKLYLSHVKGEPPALAVPARQEDYAGLPPCYTFVGDREPFYCETMTYVDHLNKAGVKAHVDVYPTGFHAFDMLLPLRSISRRAIRGFEAAYLQAVAAMTEGEAP